MKIGYRRTPGPSGKLGQHKQGKGGVDALLTIPVTFPS